MQRRGHRKEPSHLGIKPVGSRESIFPRPRRSGNNVYRPKKTRTR